MSADDLVYIIWKAVRLLSLAELNVCNTMATQLHCSIMTSAYLHKLYV